MLLVPCRLLDRELQLPAWIRISDPPDAQHLKSRPQSAQVRTIVPECHILGGVDTLPARCSTHPVGDAALAKGGL